MICGVDGAVEQAGALGVDAGGAGDECIDGTQVRGAGVLGEVVDVQEDALPGGCAGNVDDGGGEGAVFAEVVVVNPPDGIFGYIFG